MSSPEDEVSSIPPLKFVRPRRRRRWPFVVAGILVCVPLALYFGAWFSVNRGWLNSTIENEFVRKFGGKAHVEDVSTDALKNIKIDNITIEPSADGPSSTVDSIKAEWDPATFFATGRMRSVTVERPRIEIRLEPDGAMNFKIHSSANGEVAFKADTMQVHNGSLFVACGAKKGPCLSQVEGLYRDFDGAQPNSFSLKGVLESGEALGADGTVGLGDAFDANLRGGIVLDRDLGAYLSPAAEMRGHMLYDIAIKRAAAPPGKHPAEWIDFSAAVKVNSFETVLDKSAAWWLKIPAAELSLHGKAEPAGPDADSELAALHDCRVDWPGAGSLDFAAKIWRSPTMSMRVEDGTATLSLDTLSRYFEPLAHSVKMSGNATLSKLNMSFPLDESPLPITFAGDFMSRNLSFIVPGCPPAPPVDISGTLAWPSVRNTVIKMGDLLSLEFDTSDLTDISGLALTTRVRKVRLDLAKIQESAFVKTMLGDTPFAASGAITGENLQTRWLPLYSEMGASKLYVTGLSLEHVKLNKWPGSAPLPRTELNGPFAFEIEFDKGIPVGMEISLTLDGAGIPPPLAAMLIGSPKMASPDGGLRLRFDREKDGSWKPTYAGAEDFTLPLANVDALLSILGLKDVSLGGDVKAQKLNYDVLTQSVKGSLHLNATSIRAPITEEQRRQAAQLLESLNQTVLASLLRNLGVFNGIEFSKLTADAKIEADPTHVVLSGRTEGADLGVVLPIVGSYKVANVPGLSYRIEYRTPSPEHRSLEASFSTAGGKLALYATGLSKTEWKLRGVLDVFSDHLPLQLSFDGALDEATRSVTMFRIQSDALELARFAPLAGLKEDAAAVRGFIRNPQIVLLPFTFDGGMPQELHAHVSASFSEAAFEFGGCAVEQLSGPFTLNIGVSPQSVDFDANMTLQSFVALLRGRNLLVPGVPAGKSLTVMAKGSIPKNGKTPDSANGILASIERCSADFAGLASIAWSGNIHYDISGGLRQAQFEKVQVSAPNLAALRDFLVPPNLKDREPWFEDFTLSGSTRYTGSMLWESGGWNAVDGTLELTGVSAKLGVTSPIALTDATGSLPLSWRADAPQRAAMPHGKLSIGSASYGSALTGKHDLELEAGVNGVSVNGSLDFTAPGMSVLISDLEIGRRWEAGAPVLTCRSNLSIDADRLLKEGGVAFPGLQGCVLQGAPFECALRKTDGLRGPWELLTGVTREYKGGPLLTANFYGGKLVAADLNARGVLGPAPVMGGNLSAVGKGWPNANEGFNIQGILGHFPQYGQFNARLSLYLRNIEVLGPAPSEFQRATFELISAPSDEKEYFYDGNFAAALDWNQVRSSFPAFFSDTYIHTLTFGVRAVALRFRLEQGRISGPQPLLKGGYILRGYGAESNPFATRFKKDIEGEYEVNMDWAEVARQIRAKMEASTGARLGPAGTDRLEARR